ncbi:MAG: flagellar basal body P-ring formation chaperone FlgA [Candidatus Gastranaerophilales bacterium]|nr:flagellar basal body P-ring formation chaperone FlgA [Candidatus Gastranaerophilales bacterium]
MKKLLITLLISILTFGIAKADAQVITKDSLILMLQSQQEKELRAKGYKDIDVKVIHIPMQSYTFDDGVLSFKINSNSPVLLGKEYKKIDVYSNGIYQHSIGVPFEIKIYENVMIAKDIISRDSLLSSKNVEFKRANILGTPQRPLTQKDLPREMITGKMFRPGEVIDSRFCKIHPDIVRNAMVKVIFKTDDDMSIVVDGTALVEGKIGDYISVENKTYRKVYMGKVIGINKVLVEI